MLEASPTPPIVTLANGHQFTAATGASVLDAALASGVMLEHSCRTGRCGTCRTRVVSGRSSAIRAELSLSADDAEAGYILTCARQADTNLSLDTEDLSALAGIFEKTMPSRIDSLERVAADVMRVVLRLPPAAGFSFLAGQYVDVIGPGGQSRSYSIASGMDDVSRIELHVREVAGGVLSDYWFRHAKENDLLRFRGPRGTFFLRSVAGRDLIFLATGTGYAPVQSLLRQVRSLELSRRPASVMLLWGGRAATDIYADPARELGTLRVTPVVSREPGWAGARGHVQDVLVRTLSSLGNAVVYACGSDTMIQAARSTLTAAGLPPRSFYADAFVSSS